jgi:hypothetical protein
MRNFIMKSQRKKQRIFRRWAISGLVMTLCLAGSGGIWAQKPSTITPRQVVEQWLQLYPGNMDRAADMTTQKFREGVSKEEWIALREPFLKNLEMKYIRAKIVHEEIKEKEAHVIVHAHIATLMDDHPQDELYILIPNSDGGWLIDQVEVYTETFNRAP